LSKACSLSSPARAMAGVMRPRRRSGPGPTIPLSSPPHPLSSAPKKCHIFDFRVFGVSHVWRARFAAGFFSSELLAAQGLVRIQHLRAPRDTTPKIAQFRGPKTLIISPPRCRCHIWTHLKKNQKITKFPPSQPPCGIPPDATPCVTRAKVGQPPCPLCDNDALLWRDHVILSSDPP